MLAPSRVELDLLRPNSALEYCRAHQPEILIHAAAFTDLPRAEREPELCWAINVEGTRRVALAAEAVGARLLHISTDYVFDGRRGNYREDDPLGPAFNGYAESKIAAEKVVLESCNSPLIVRTSFRVSPWPYPFAYTDVFTSQDYLDVIAPMVLRVILEEHRLPGPWLHVGTERKSFYQLAHRRSSQVQPAERTSAPVPLPEDTSLNLDLWQRFVGGCGEGL